MAVPQWTTACPDWADRIVARDSLVPVGALFPKVAAHALGVFKSLQVTDLPQKGDGTYPTLGEICDEFVFDLVAALFGAEDGETGERLIKEVLLLISKKNGKSLIAAGIMVTALIINWRHHNELLILAPTIEVAGNSFNPASGMVRADPELDALMHVVENTRTIKHRVTGAELKIVAADSGVVGGKKAGFVLVEELWLFGKNGKAAAMLAEATGGLATKPEGFVVFITTHSDEPPAGVFKEKLAYARDVRDGKIDDPAFLPILYEWPEDMLEDESYLDPDFFYVTNPSLGRSVTMAFLKRELGKAQAGDGDETIQVFLAKHLNVEIGLRLRRDRWSAATVWEDAADDDLDLDALLARCEVAIVGIDGGGSDDLFGLAVVGRERETGIWLAWAHAWVQRIALTRRQSIVSMLHGFEADGDLTICDSGIVLLEQMATVAAKVRATGLMPKEGGIAIDPWSMGPIVDALVEAGFDPGDESAKRAGHMFGIKQGVALSSAIHTVEFKLNNDQLRHDGSEMMNWCVSNALVQLRGSNRFVSKELSGAGKIDPLIAVLNAVKVMETGPVAGGLDISPYRKRGLLVV
ncbi:terminase TerL endonuclease subunit [Sphingopyxis sp. J-6]|uniref:terminase large subunit n=1 Tax=Sphingopyxis sp. J-6 TaxID=3122054 RepID=UPI0039841890